MNTNDLPAPVRFAALIESGRAANQDLRHARFRLLDEGRACALGFAGLGAGMTRKELLEPDLAYMDVIERCGVSDFRVGVLDVIDMNDKGWTLEQICHELREGALAKIQA